MEDNVGAEALNNLSQKRLKIIDVSVSIYCCIIKYMYRIDMINKVKKLKGVLSDIESDSLGDNKGMKKKDMESEYQNKQKNVHNKKMEYMEM